MKDKLTMLMILDGFGDNPHKMEMLSNWLKHLI